MIRAGLFLLLTLAACRHVPPDLEARAVRRPPAVRRAPTAAELAGRWTSRTVRGTLAEIGTFALYVFGPDGRYTGALASETESTPLEGSYVYADGVLAFDDGAVEMKAALVGEHLELTSEGTFLEMVRSGSAHRAPEGGAP